MIIQHPVGGETLDDFITRDSALRRVARTVGLSEQIAATLTDAFGAALPGVARAAHVLGELAYTQARRAVVGHRVLNLRYCTDVLVITMVRQ